MSDVQVVTLAASIIAMLISLMSLWIGSLKPFHLTTLYDSPTFGAYKITPGISGDRAGNTWWIPSFDMGLSFCNTGARHGQILDVRLIAEATGRLSKKQLVFYPKWIVEYSKFQGLRPDRMAWLRAAVIREWYPVLLLGKSQAHYHLIFEGDRWDHKDLLSMNLKLEIATNPGSWQKAGAFTLTYGEDVFDTNCTYTVHDAKVESLRKL